MYKESIVIYERYGSDHKLFISSLVTPCTSYLDIGPSKNLDRQTNKNTDIRYHSVAPPLKREFPIFDALKSNCFL